MAVGKFQWEKAIRDFSDLPAGVRLVAYTLTTWMDAVTGKAFPSIDTLKRGTGQGRSTVIRHLNKLDGEGWLDRRRGGGTDQNGRGISTRYAARIPPEILAEIEEQAASDDNNSPDTGLPTVPTTPTTVPIEAPNSPAASTGTTKNNQEQAAALSQLEIQEKYPEVWAEARDEVARRIATGQIILKPDAYAVPIFKELLDQRCEMNRADARELEAVAAIADCGRCDKGGWYWEKQEPPYGDRRILCSHGDTADGGPANGSNPEHQQIGRAHV